MEYFMKFCCWLTMVFVSISRATGLECAPQYGHYEGCNFLPALPGHTPHCARPGFTYCEKISHYPMKRIHYLLDKWNYDFHSILKDESVEEFESSYKHLNLVYGPPMYTPPKPIQIHSEPIHIPKPALHHGSGYPAGNLYLPPPINGGSNYTHFNDYRDRKPNYQQTHLNPNHLQDHFHGSFLQESGNQQHAQYAIYPSQKQVHHSVYPMQSQHQLLPEEWLQRYARLAKHYDGSHKRYKRRASKRKTISKNKVETFKALITKKNRSHQQSYANQSQNNNDEKNMNQRSQIHKGKTEAFLSIIDDVSKKEITNARQKRQATVGVSQQLCRSRSQFVMPQAALNNRGDWMYLVNLPDVDARYTQLVKSETCASTQCDALCSLPSGYTSRCEQKYVQKRLVALEGGGQNLYTDVFWFPSCCVCTISN